MNNGTRTGNKLRTELLHAITNDFGEVSQDLQEISPLPAKHSQVNICTECGGPLDSLGATKPCPTCSRIDSVEHLSDTAVTNQQLHLHDKGTDKLSAAINRHESRSFP